MRAVQLTAYGNPIEGLKYVNLPEPDAPGSNEVLIEVEFSPLNNSDLLIARGIYPSRPALPTVIGNEGVGRVLKVGAGVKNVKVGDRVLPPLSSFTWQERMILPANGLFALPPGADPQQLSMLAINPPTAALLLSEYVNLKPLEWVVQNSANSSVGRWVIAFAKARDLKTVNIVRRPELVAELKAVGADVVVVDSPNVTKDIKAAVGKDELRLALDGVSGPASGVIASTLSPRGTLVSYAAMSAGPMSISPLDVIFKPLTVRGFWLGHPESAAKSAPAIAQAAEMIASGRVHIPVAATYPLSSIKEAVAHAQRGGKILLEVAGSSTR
ncbi:MAG TPA: zinc-dependent alcohol dehydrogenase family protein [Candidatus Binatus sp.]|uniref:zinc-dependent alcohol dehydrogenase family protein n=1 Tax=Candidatus Binatus sp. TaxID=2811406 RepID=UPI002F404A21